LVFFQQNGNNPRVGSKYSILMINAKGLAAYWHSKGHAIPTIHAKRVTQFRAKVLASLSVTS
jgi:hypothetical protein